MTKKARIEFYVSREEEVANLEIGADVSGRCSTTTTTCCCCGAPK